MQTSLKRILSIDVFRALTMLWMIFVNDLWSLKGIPYWLEHAKATEDMLGFADVVFPCFLFILGMAIPFAIQNRIVKGDSNGQIVRHIATRSVALLVMGIFTVNVDGLNAQSTGMSREWFQILMVLGFFLIWNVYPKSEGLKKIIFVGLQALGICLLIYLAFIFRGGEDGSLVRMAPQWWGILGLIGWTYLGCALIYLFFRTSPVLLVVSWAFFSFMTIAGHAGWLLKIWPNGPTDWILGNGAFHSFASAGILATLLLERFYTPKKKTSLIPIFIGIGVLFLIAGFISRNFFIISKIQATSTWVFLCCGIAFLLYTLMYWLVDIQGKTHWFAPIKVAGTSTLTCYLIPYVYYSVAEMLPFSIPESLKFGAVGLIKSLLFAFLIIGITAILGRMKIKLKI
jgi:heparan-alpha-glucosaminide N-acetyltransferase